MASYCEVCQGLYDIPHPHLRLQRSPLSPPPWKRGNRNPVCPSSLPPERRGSGGIRGSRGLSWPRVASRQRETPHALRSPFLEARGSGRDCVGPYVCPRQQRRSASMPAVPDSYTASASHAASHSSPSLGRRVSPGADGGVGCGDEQDVRHRCSTSLRPPMPAFAAAGRRGSPFIERYCEDTYCSQRRADGNPPQLDYLRRGAGHVCTYMSPYDDGEGDGERISLTPDGGDTAFTSSSFSPCAPADARHHRCASAGRPLHVCRASSLFPCDDLGRGGELGSRIPHHSSSSRSLENATRYASERDARPRSRRDTSADHPSRRISPAVDGGDRRGTHMPSVHNDTGSGEPSSSKRLPLLPTAASMTPASSFAGLTLDAEQRAQASASFEAPLHFSRHGDAAWQPAASAGPLPSRARDSLANLVAKIRAEVSKDVTSRATRAPSNDPLLSPADAKPWATAEDKRQRHRCAAKPQEQGYAPGATSYAEQTSAAQATASSLLSSSAVSTGAEGTAAFHVLAARRSFSAGDNRGSHAYRPSAAPPAASGQARSARSHRRRSSTAEYCHPSRPRHSASLSLSACSTRSSSSSVHLRHTVRRAEAVLGRLRGRSHSNGGSRAPSPAAKTTTRGFVGNSLADDAAAAGATTVHGRRNTSAHSSAHGKDCARLQSGRGRRRHSAPPLPSRPHTTRVPSRRSSLSAPTDAFSTESPGAPQRVHPPDRAARKATRDVGQARDDASAAMETVAESRREQEMWRATQEHRIERLREGLSALCTAVRKDLQKVRDEVGRVRDEVGRVRAAGNGTADDTQKRMRGALATALRSNSPDERATHARRREVDFHPSSVVAAVTQCTPAEQRRLAMLLLPHFRPLLADLVQSEVQCQLRQHRDEQQEAQHELEQRLHTYVGEAVVSHQGRTRANETLGSEGIATAPFWATFSSADAFDAHLRSATRAVLLEEDDRRYSLANENERRHERRVQKLKQGWQETLKTAQAEWKAEWKAILEKEANAWTCRAQASLQQQADMLQDIVKALTRDVTHLQEQQEALSARLSTSLRHEREVRVQEQTQLTERVEQRVRQLLPREAESACVRFHALREQRLAAAASRGTLTELTTPGASRRSATPTTSAAAAAAAPSSAEELRLSIVQPAMEHMRRLLVLHQEMIDATVEARCRRAEHTVEGNRHVWSQNVAELRSKLSALRADVRGALGELCENLNVASPAL
ncbi:conserved hypothetical protein [Leishmania major strain Friedlin]|uniref:Uncharacterized protein n=1 Tax=Leishmania major TaxID=5664 RepID=Q4QED7_LEIMA|nr:conserved hypothetical protein [Leishmania major strain Friedlin]CAG9572282.1 hypothetical_protein_-_conserved [Leishmania major strain Friedlin]CAJ03573.1 conserved hypothetical protein [Leishmania major strain Friedlin]|eukprot:XP_001682311.1 conserved hypothetical protein [Leishmania major strain Friedlin]